MTHHDDTFPVVERIAQAIEQRLRDLLQENGFRTSVREVLRPARYNPSIVSEGRLILSQSERIKNDELSSEGNPATYAWDQDFEITLFVIQSDKSCQPIDQIMNVFVADVERCLETEPTFPRWGDLAVDTEIKPAVYEQSEDASYCMITVPVTVTYRTPSNNPYIAG